MSKLIIAYGPSASGKTTAAREWKLGDPDHRLIIDEGGFSQVAISKHVVPQLDAGNDVWMNILVSEAATLEMSIEGYEVEMRKFGHKPYGVVG